MSDLCLDVGDGSFGVPVYDVWQVEGCIDGRPVDTHRAHGVPSLPQ